MKISASLALSLVVSTGFLVPSANAATTHQTNFHDKTAAILHQLHQHSPVNLSKSASFSAQAVDSEVTYKQQILENQVHEYHFETTGGTFTLTEPNPNDMVSFEIDNFDTAVSIDPSADGSYQLPAGKYAFFVIGASDASEEYEYTLKGPFSGQPDATLPLVQLSSPVQSNLQLSKTSSKSLTFSGSSNAAKLTLSTFNEDFDLTPPGSFDKKVNLDIGRNHFILTSENDNGNAVTSYYSVDLLGLIRLDGKDRYEVSGKISDELNYIGAVSDTVIIAKGDVFADALSGGPLAFSESAPILLTGTQHLPDSVKAKITNLGATKAIILGGTGSVSLNVETELKQLGVTSIDRIGGKDRYEVSATTANRVAESFEPDTAIIASGEVFPDALSASSIAGPNGFPILLVNSGSVPASIQSFIKSHPAITHFVVAGGPATVKDTVISQIKSLSNGAAVDRITGKDRYEVAINVAHYGIAHYGMDLSTVVFARGDLFPDALSGAPLANFYGAPILLTHTASLDPAVSQFLDSRKETHIMYILGGTGSVSTNTEAQLYNKLP